MAMTMKTEGVEQLSEMLSSLGERAEEVAARSLYKGAGVMANAYTNAVNRIVTSKRHPDKKEKRYATDEEKAALQGKIGIAKFDMNGTEVGTAVGVSGGYVTIGGKQKAVRMLANAINSGTSFMHKQPVFRRAATQTRQAASEAIVAEAEKQINEITK